jgi:hypothetical protein
MRFRSHPSEPDDPIKSSESRISEVVPSTPTKPLVVRWGLALRSKTNKLGLSY